MLHLRSDVGLLYSWTDNFQGPVKQAGPKHGGFLHYSELIAILYYANAFHHRGSGTKFDSRWHGLHQRLISGEGNIISFKPCSLKPPCDRLLRLQPFRERYQRRSFSDYDPCPRNFRARLRCVTPVGEEDALLLGDQQCSGASCKPAKISN